MVIPSTQFDEKDFAICTTLFMRRNQSRHYLEFGAIIIRVVIYFIAVHVLFWENAFRVSYKAGDLFCKLFGRKPGKQNKPRVLFRELVRAFTPVSTFLGASENKFDFRNLIWSEKVSLAHRLIANPEVGCPLIIKWIILMNEEVSNNLVADHN